VGSAGTEAAGGVTRRIARYLTDLRYDDLPAGAVQAAKDALLDQLGIMMTGSTLPWTEPAYRVVREIGRPGDSTVVGHGDRLSALDAATVNATYAHSCELDDSGYRGGCHSGALSVPCALALAESMHLSGRDLLLGIVIGYEILYRIGRVLSRPVVELGFHHQSVVGPFGVAAVAAALLGLSAEQAVHALSIAGSHSSGVMEYDQHGGEVKRYHNAMATRAGMTSVLLARAGLTGPPTILEGRRGVVRLFGRVDDPSYIVDGLDDRSWFAVQGRTTKVYPTVGTVPTSIQALARIMDEHAFRPEDVVRIDVWVQPNALLHGASIYEPTDTISAQFSLAFSLGLRLVKGRNELRDYMDPTLWTDPAVLAVGKRLRVHGDPRYGRRAEGEGGSSIDWTTVNGARVRVELRDGRVLEAEEPYRKGSMMNPITTAELHEKFRGLAAAVLDPAGTDRVIETVADLERLDDTAALPPLLVRPR
jgi:2-methylcitrate dehydratase PrpD